MLWVDGHAIYRHLVPSQISYYLVKKVFVQIVSQPKITVI